LKNIKKKELIAFLEKMMISICTRLKTN